MKVVHLATTDLSGGAARAAYRQHRALVEAGFDSQMCVRFKSSTDDRVQAFSPASGVLGRLRRVSRRTYLKFWEQCANRQAVNNGGAGRLTDPRADLIRAAEPLLKTASVVDVHKVENFVDLPALFRALPSSIPIVVTLHDLSFMTGGCDYSGDCDRFEHSCGNCPLILSRRANDASAAIHRMKRAAYGYRARERLVFVANSHWTLQQARRSSLLQNQRCMVIHLGLDTRVYNPRRRQIARQALGLPESGPVVMFAAHDVTLVRKGARFLREALQDGDIAEETVIVTFGASGFSAGGRRHFHFGNVNDERLQSLIYQAADVFVMPSLEEAFGLTALEAVACGTVVAGFAVGGVPDIVENGLNGILVSAGDSTELRRAIVKLLANTKLRQDWIDRAEPWVKERFSYEVNAARYIDLYRQLTGDQASAT